MKKKCVIIGAGTYGQVYAAYLKDEYEVLGFLDSNQKLFGTSILGFEVLGDIDILKNWDRSINIFVPIGKAATRIKLLREVREMSFKTPNFIHSNVCMHDSVELGECVYILPGTNIMPLVKIEDYVMISIGVNIAHHTILSKGVFLSQGSNIGASILVEENAFCGIAST
ncbi:MAG: sialic acid O-acetyltransferase, partial [Proteiniphilum sp.]